MANYDHDQYNPELCEERRRSGQQRYEILAARQATQESRFNALIMFLLASLVGILIYVGQSMFQQVFVSPPKAAVAAPADLAKKAGP